MRPSGASEVRRDAWGVPHVRADDELALARAQGLVTARDRTWQLRLLRAQVTGSSAALLGAAGLAWDELAHRVRLADTAVRAYDALADDDRAWVDAYAAGVRTGLATAGRTAEERELDRVLPARAGTDDDPWPAWASLGALHAYHVLFSTFPQVLWHAHVARLVRDAPPGSPLAGLDPLRLLALFDPAEGGPTAGSNAWAVHGSRTAHGAPLLAGDPHRLLDLPGTYQQVRLACPAYDVVGLAFVGVPGVAHFGHTGGAAWGITNAMAHSTEVLHERLRRDPDGAWRAWGPDGWERVEQDVAQVHVRGGRPVDVEVVETPRGPLVVRGLPVRRPVRPDAVPHARDDEPGDEDAYALRLAARTGADVGIAAVRRLLHARTAHDVHAAFDGWVDPVNRVVAADTGGTVLAFDAGRVADRPREQRLVPLVAWEPAHARPAWRRLAPARAVTDVHVDANERPADPARDHGAVYAPDRGDRLRALLADRTGLSPTDLAALHGDVRLAEADRLLALVARVDGLDARAAALRDRLLAWDRRMAAASTDAGAYAAVRAVLVELLAAEPALAALGAPHGCGAVLDPWFGVRARIATVVPALLDPTARGVGLGVDTDAHVRTALARVAAGPAPGPWGARHTALPAHVLDDVPGAVAPSCPALPLGGDQDTVRCTGSVPGVTDRAYRGSVARWVWDLADRDRSRWVVPFGADGDPGAPHFTDQHEVWAAGGTVEVVTRWDLLEPDAADLPARSTVPGPSPVAWAAGPRGAVVAEAATAVGRVTCTVLDPDADLAVLHAWVTARGTGFWGLGHLTADELRDTYAHVDGLAHHHGLLVRADGVPVALMQVYDPGLDPLGEVYDVQPGDLGVHVLVGARPPGGTVAGLLAAVFDLVATLPGVRRVVGEPDAANTAILRHARAVGFELGPVVDLPTKRARLVWRSTSPG